MQDITFICCVESGFLESQTVLMVESLRRYGGAYKDLPIIAMTPRFGPPISKLTKEAFKALDVSHVSFRAKNKFSWKAFLNKHYSMAKAEEICDSKFLCWLDSDLLFTDEPSGLFLEDSEDFTACPSDVAGASCGLDDPMDIYWKEVCSIFGIDIECLPWVKAFVEKKDMRFYFNSGIFLYRRETQLSRQHLENTLKFFEAKISSKTTGSFFTQHILGLTVHQMGLTWKILPHTHNYGTGAKMLGQWMSPASPVNPDDETLRNCKVIHYHNVLWPKYYDQFFSLLERFRPEAASWLQKKGPLVNTAPLIWRGTGRVIKALRAKEEARYIQQCQIL